MDRDKLSSWSEIKLDVSKLRRQLTCLSASLPANVSFRTLPNGKIRVYFLSCPTNGWEMTLLYVDVSTTETFCSLLWHPFVERIFSLGLGRFSREEQLQWERKRLSSWGITSYEIDSQSGRIVFPAASTLYHCIDSGILGELVTPVKVGEFGRIKLSPQICPSNSSLVAYISSNDLWVTVLPSGFSARLTETSLINNASGSDKAGYSHIRSSPISAAHPSYVMQEEFNRYLGFWWRPQDENGVYQILYEEVDESEVSIVQLYGNGEVEEVRFPRAGTTNAISDLKLVEFRLTESLEVTAVRSKPLHLPLSNYFPWAEYMVRAGWIPTASHIWVQMLDRRQKRLDLAVIPISEFTRSRDPSSTKRPTFYTIHSQISDIWINVDDLLIFITEPQGKNYDEMFSSLEVVLATEETGFRHLYLVKSWLPHLGQESHSEAAEVIALTSGKWPVVGRKIWFDSRRRLVYFLGLRENPLEKHLYVVSLAKPNQVRLLTSLGYSYTVWFNEDCSLLVATYSNTVTLPACQAFLVQHNYTGSIDGITLVSAGFLLEPRSAPSVYCPSLYSYRISSGDLLYAMVLLPHSFELGRKYPTVVNVYGGPEVQLVSNKFKGMRQLRMHMLAARGYCVVAIDSRGSQNRGLDFEGHIKGRMGTVELADQVEVLQYLASHLDCIDLNRVAIHGWSYGGYLSLMALVQHPDVFKLAIAGAPVTSWYLYDTAYTERYMDLPESNVSGYKSGSVINYANKFPDEENRLLIFHGLIDENVHFSHTSELVNALVKEGKPYQLQVYPTERHSLRSLDGSKHYETALISFLTKYL